MSLVFTKYSVDLSVGYRHKGALTMDGYTLH